MITAGTLIFFRNEPSPCICTPSDIADLYGIVYRRGWSITIRQPAWSFGFLVSWQKKISLILQMIFTTCSIFFSLSYCTDIKIEKSIPKKIASHSCLVQSVTERTASRDPSFLSSDTCRKIRFLVCEFLLEATDSYRSLILNQSAVWGKLGRRLIRLEGPSRCFMVLGQLNIRFIGR